MASEFAIHYDTTDSRDEEAPDFNPPADPAQPSGHPTCVPHVKRESGAR